MATRGNTWQPEQCLLISYCFVRQKPDTGLQGADIQGPTRMHFLLDQSALLSVHLPGRPPSWSSCDPPFTPGKAGQISEPPLLLPSSVSPRPLREPGADTDPGDEGL